MSAAERLRARGGVDALRDVVWFLPLLFTAWLVWKILSGYQVGVDFHFAYLPAAQRLLHGADPYSWSEARVRAGEAFVYPALAAWLFVPFALLPVGVANLLATFLCIAVAPLTLLVLGVRDRRLLCFVLGWPAVVAGWQTANVTLWLGLGLAGLWRVRDRPWAAGAIAAVLVSIKPFTWPVVLWLIATRRFRAAGTSVVVGLLVNLVVWAPLGVREIHQYLTLSGRVTDALFRHGYGVPALAGHIGLSSTGGDLLGVALGVAAAVWCGWSARSGGDLPALCAAVALMLIASPLVWDHYFALLLVPLAIARPRLAAAWFLPLVLWPCPSQGVALWQILLTWAVSAGVLAACLRSAVGARARRPGLPHRLGPAFRLASTAAPG